MKDKHCIVCTGEQFNLEMSLTDHSITKEKFDLHRCTKCGFIFTENAPSKINISKYYQSEDYISHSDTNKGIVNKLYHLIRKIMLQRKYRLIKKLIDDKTILDIGCGTGYFLNYMKKKQYETLGVEVDREVREYGKSKFQINILPPENLINGSVKMRFSIITLWHVLEHLYTPRDYLQIAKRLLKDDSYLIIALPNYSCFDAKYYKSFWAGYDVPRHLWHFSPKTFEIFAQDMGFEITKIKRLLFDSFHNSILSERYRNSKLSFFRGILVGLISLIYSLFDIRKSSSIIYVIKKTTSNNV